MNRSEKDLADMMQDLRDPLKQEIDETVWN